MDETACEDELVTIAVSKKTSKGDLMAACDFYNEENKQLKAELENWKEAAREFCNNEAYYRGELDKVLGLFGQKGYVSDDGSVQSEPLRAKAYQLVGDVIEELEEAKAQIQYEQAVKLDLFTIQKNRANAAEDEVERLKGENNKLMLILRSDNHQKACALIEAQQEVKRLKAEYQSACDAYAVAFAQLSRYVGGVEVEGRISKVGQWQPSDGWDTICDRFLGQRVKILVMKEEV